MPTLLLASCPCISRHSPDHSRLLPYPTQVMKLVRQGSRPDIPPPSQLPGPSPACFPGMGDYLLLMRCAGVVAVAPAPRSRLGMGWSSWMGACLWSADCCWCCCPLPQKPGSNRRQCWAQDPAQRPSFAAIAPRLHALLEQLEYGAAEV